MASAKRLQYYALSYVYDKHTHATMTYILQKREWKLHIETVRNINLSSYIPSTVLMRMVALVCSVAKLYTTGKEKSLRSENSGQTVVLMMAVKL